MVPNLFFWPFPYTKNILNLGILAYKSGKDTTFGVKPPWTLAYNRMDMDSPTSSGRIVLPANLLFCLLSVHVVNILIVLPAWWDIICGSGVKDDSSICWSEREHYIDGVDARQTTWNYSITGEYNSISIKDIPNDRTPECTSAHKHSTQLLRMQCEVLILKKRFCLHVNQ